ncbi:MULTISPECIES: hypothetical protein [unclassified Bradyrhizobium]|uniref:hypothetical protein n=1 Tax=unclassified Bradyrhizobium TaxID=2631580 RepID=UPI002915DB63|nr:MULTISPECIES: hypothetical protein [unclassified Bradyrhizobium]
MRSAILLCGLLAAATPARAEWVIASSKDRLTDKETRIASVAAARPDQGVAARLVVRCLEDKLVGGLIMAIETTASFTRGRMGLRFRIDHRDPEARFMPVSGSGKGMSQWLDPEELRGARRLRVELEPARSPNLFYDFDLTGVDKALGAIPCVRSRP